MGGEPGPVLSIETPTTKGNTSPFSNENQPLVDLEPELRLSSSTRSNQMRTILDLIISVKAIKLHLYDALASSQANLKDHGIAKFALNDNNLRLKLLSDGAGEAQVVLRSFTVSNTRPGNTKFREIIPAAQHDRNQFMALYTMSGGSSGATLAVLTVDSPKIIFALDPVIALLDFFTSAFPATPPMDAIDDPPIHNQMTEPSRGATMDFRVDLHDVSVSVLQDDGDQESQSIRLSVKQILLSQQVIPLCS